MEQPKMTRTGPGPHGAESHRPGIEHDRDAPPAEGGRHRDRAHQRRCSRVPVASGGVRAVLPRRAGPAEALVAAWARPALVNLDDFAAALDAAEPDAAAVDTLADAAAEQAVLDGQADV